MLAIKSKKKNLGRLYIRTGENLKRNEISKDHKTRYLTINKKIKTKNNYGETGQVLLQT